MRKTKRGEPKKKQEREKFSLLDCPKEKKRKKRDREHIRRHKCISAETNHEIYTTLSRVIRIIMSDKNDDEEAFGAAAVDDEHARKEEQQKEEEERWPSDRKQFRKDFVPFDEKLERKLLRQLEFYFSDSNLPRDKFLRETVERDPDAYVDLKLILKFQRMRDILNDSGGSNNPEVVEAVAKLLKEKSVSLQVAEETSPDPRVRRKEDLRPKEEIDRDVEKRSLYANPFPMTATIESLTDFFEKECDERVLSVRLRRHIASKDFKGSIFVEFSSEESAKKVSGMSNTLVYEGAELTLMFKKEYLEKKKEEKALKAEQKAKEEADRAANPEKYAKLDEERKRAEREVVMGDRRHDNYNHNNGSKRSRDDDDDRGGGRRENKENNGEPREEKEVVYTPGMIARITLGEKANMEWNDFVKFREGIKSAFESYGKIKFVDFKQGEKSGFLRFEDEKVAAKIIESIQGGNAIEVEGDACAIELVGGDEEKSYWEAIDRRARDRDRQDRNGNKRDHRGGGRGGGRGRGNRGRGGGGGGGNKRHKSD